MNRKTTIILTLLLAMFAAGCSVASSAINETCLVYTGGIVEDKGFEKILPPGSTNNGIGVGSEAFCYPNDQRSWVSGQDAPEIEVVSSDEIRLQVPYQLYFTINTKQDVIQEFHENIGVKVKAWTPEGWTGMLNTYFAPQVDRAMDEAALKFDWRDLRSSEEARQQFQREVVTSLKRKVTEVIGGDYFCGPSYTGAEDSPCGDFTFTVGKPEPTNANLVTAIEQEQINQANVAAQEAENLRIEAESRGIEFLIDRLGPEAYICLRQLEVALETGQSIPLCNYTNGNAEILVTDSVDAAVQQQQVDSN